MGMAPLGQILFASMLLCCPTRVMAFEDSHRRHFASEVVAVHVLVIRELCVVLQVWKKAGVVNMLGRPCSNRPGPGRLCQLDHVLYS